MRISDWSSDVCSSDLRDLIEQLRRWRGGLVVVSHDRRLLESMARIIELSDLGLRSYGGGYSLYADIKAQERALAIEKLDRRKAERRREVHALTQQRERLDRRQSRGAKDAAKANQAAILLGLQKQRSQRSEEHTSELQSLMRTS